MQKSDNFILREHLHLPCFLRWQLTADGGIGANQALLHRPLQGHTAVGMNGTHHTVGKAGSQCLGTDFSTAVFHPCIELLQIRLRQLIQRNFADIGNDVIINSVFIFYLRCQANGVLAVDAVLEVDPIPERHIRFDFVRVTAVLLFQLFQLCTAFRFRFCGYILGDRPTVLTVIGHNAAFPPPVFSQAKCTFAFGTFFIQLLISA